MAVSSASDANNEFLDLIIANQNLYLKQVKWFDLLHDDGVAMTAQEKPQYSGNPDKNNWECVRHGEHFFGSIYKLAKIMVHLYQIKGGIGDEGEDDAEFPKIFMSQPALWKNSQQIGSFIFKRSSKVARGDMNSITDAKFTTETQRDEYKYDDYFYFLSQVELLHWAKDHWGRSQADLMKFIPDDKLRLVEIVSGMEDLKDYVGYLTKATKSGTCRNLYGFNTQQLAALSLAHDKFIDK